MEYVSNRGAIPTNGSGTSVFAESNNSLKFSINSDKIKEEFEQFFKAKTQSVRTMMFCSKFLIVLNILIFVPKRILMKTINFPRNIKLF